MGNRFFTAMTMSLFVFLLVCLPADAKDDDVRIVTESFVNTVKNQIKIINESEQLFKNKPELGLQYSNSDRVWRTCYYNFHDDFKYDIKKSESSASPYIAVADIEVTVWKRVGATGEECLAAKRISKFESLVKVKYTYRDGKWVAEEDLESIVQRWRKEGEDLGC